MKHSVACMKHSFNFKNYSEVFDIGVIDYLKIYFGLCSLFRFINTVNDSRICSVPIFRCLERNKSNSFGTLDKATAKSWLEIMTFNYLLWYNF
jgi:hypothetical protein